MIRAKIPDIKPNLAAALRELGLLRAISPLSPQIASIQQSRDEPIPGRPPHSANNADINRYTPVKISTKSQISNKSLFDDLEKLFPMGPALPPSTKTKGRTGACAECRSKKIKVGWSNDRWKVWTLTLNSVIISRKIRNIMRKHLMGKSILCAMMTPGKLLPPPGQI